MLSPRRLPSEFLAARRLLLLAVGMGAIWGGLAYGLQQLIGFLQRWLLADTLGLNPPGLASQGEVLQLFTSERAKWLPLICGLAFGSLGWLLGKYKILQSDGVGQSIKDYHAAKAAPSLQLAGLGLVGLVEIVLGTPIGPEGAFTHLARAPLQGLAKFLKLSKQDEQWLGLIALSAVLSVILQAPIAGAILAVEILYRRFDLETEILAASLSASLAAYTIYSGLASILSGNAPSLFSASATSWSWQMLVAAIVIGACAAALVWFINLVSTATLWLIKKLNMPVWLLWLLGGLAIGTILWLEPGNLGLGLGWMQLALDKFLPWADALRLSAWRTLAMMLLMTMSTSAGRIWPSIVIGGLGAYSLAGMTNSFGLNQDPTSFVWLGAAACLTTAARTPLGAGVLMLEWGAGNIFPAIAVAIVVAFNLGRNSIFEHQTDDHNNSLNHVFNALSSLCGTSIVVEDIKTLPKQTKNGMLQSIDLPSAWQHLHLHELEWPQGQTLAAIERDGDLELPHDEFLLHAGDKLLVLFDTVQ